MNKPEIIQSSTAFALQHRPKERPRLKWELSNAHREQFLSLSLDMLCVASSDGYFKWVNPAFGQTLGWTTNELLARPFAEFIHPDDLASTHLIVEKLIIAKEKVFNYENRYRHGNGSWRVISWRAVPQGELMYAAGRDITEQKRLERELWETNAGLEQLVDQRTSQHREENVAHQQTGLLLRESEDKFRLLINNINDYGLCMLDPDGNVSSWNAGAERMKGYLADEIIGKSFACFYSEEDRSADLPGIALDTAAKNGRYEVEGCWRVRKDGSRFWASIIIYAIRNESGVLTNFAKITRDITAQHEAEIEKVSMQKRLAQSQKMEAIGQLTGGVAHDFNNLLTVILANSDMLAEDIKDQDLRGLAAMIRTAAERGAELTNSLLAFARRQPLEPKSVSANKLLAGMDKLLRRALGEQIEIDLIQTAGVWHVMVDPTQLESAVLNLAINARDAMPGGGRLTIETGNADIDETYGPEYDDVVPGQYVQICVSDTGTGMSPEIAAQAFEPFFTTKEVGKGTGLGLSMVYGFVKQSGGHIKIYSEIGHGTTFKIYLQRSMETAVSDEAKMTGALNEPGGTETILIVEDDDLVREHVERLLKTLGYRVLVASNGSEAMQMLEDHDRVDLLFTDVVMPGGMSGRQLADKAAALLPSLPILFTSGYTQNVIIHEGRLDKGVQLLRKPYRRRDLALKLRQMLETQSDS